MSTCVFNLQIIIGGAVVIPDVSSGNPAVFSGGPYAAGLYTVFYIRGALRYNPMQGWALNARNVNPNSGYVVVFGGGSSQFPGTQDTNFPSQQAVEDANSGVSIQIAHGGGNISVFLQDDIYGDNVPGSPNPTFGLTPG